jgi:hypothetical protein
LDDETCKADAHVVGKEDCQCKLRLHCESQEISKTSLVETLRLLRVAAAMAIRLLHLRLQILGFDAETGKDDARWGLQLRLSIQSSTALRIAEDFKAFWLKFYDVMLS